MYPCTLFPSQWMAISVYILLFCYCNLSWYGLFYYYWKSLTCLEYLYTIIHILVNSFLCTRSPSPSEWRFQCILLFCSYCNRTLDTDYLFIWIVWLAGCKIKHLREPHILCDGLALLDMSFFMLQFDLGMNHISYLKSEMSKNYSHF